MAIRDHLNPASSLTPTLALQEQSVETLAGVKPGRDDVDGKRSFRKTAAALTQQIHVAESYAQDADPQVAKAGQLLLHKLHTDRLVAEDPILAGYVTELLDGLQAKQGAKLQDHELDVVIALVGGEVSEAEAHALRLLKPFMTAAQEQSAYQPLMQANYHAETAEHRGKKANLAGIGRAFPIVPILTTGALTMTEVIAGPVAMVSSIVAIATGTEIGSYFMQASDNVDDDFGVNRLDNVEVDKELGRVRERASKLLHQLTWDAPPKDLPKRAKLEASLAREMVRMNRAKGGSDEKALAAIETYATALEAVEKSPESALRQIRSATDTLMRSVSSKVAARASVGLAPGKRVPDEALVHAVDDLVQRTNDSVLGLTNGPLLRHLGMLEEKHRIADRLAADRANQTIPAKAKTKLEASELRTLQRLVGDTPSLSEFLGMAKLHQAGALDLKSVYPADLKVTLPNGSHVEAKVLTEAMDQLGDRSSATTQEEIAKALPGVGMVGGYGGAIIFAMLQLYPLAIITLLSGRIGSMIGAGLLKKSAQKQKLMAGLDLAPGRPTSREYTLLTSRAQSLSSLLAGSASDIRARLREESELALALIANVRAMVAFMPEAESKAFIQNQEPMYQALTEWAKTAQALSQSRISEGDLRKQVTEAQHKLLTPSFLETVRNNVLYEQIESDRPEGLFDFLREKQRFMASLQTFVDGATASGETPINKPLLVQAIAVKDAFEELPKSMRKALGKDAVDELAKHVNDNAYERADLTRIKGILEKSKQLEEEWNDAVKEHGPIDGDRADAVAQEILDAVWTQINPMLGLGGHKDGRPKLKPEQTGKETQETGLPYYFAHGKVGSRDLFTGESKDGFMGVVMDAFGIPNLQSLSIDFGERFTGQLAQHVVRDQVSAAGGRSVEAWNPRMVGKDEETGNYTFRVETSAGPYQIGFTEGGFPLLDTLGKAASR